MTDDEKKLTELLERLKLKTDADKYRSEHAVAYKPSTTEFGYTCIDVLQHLWGLPLCDLIMAYVHALRPEAVRITTGGVVTCDAWTSRVTIVVDVHDYVQHIYQEVRICYGTGWDVGQCLHAIKTGKPPQVFPDVVGHTAGLEQADFQ